MKGRIVGKGLALVVLALVAGACGSDELYKWSCDCGVDSCAATSEEASRLSRCTSGVAECTPTGDSCVCPDEADSCEIVLP